MQMGNSQVIGPRAHGERLSAGYNCCLQPYSARHPYRVAVLGVKKLGLFASGKRNYAAIRQHTVTIQDQQLDLSYPLQYVLVYLRHLRTLPSRITETLTTDH